MFSIKALAFKEYLEENTQSTWTGKQNTILDINAVNYKETIERLYENYPKKDEIEIRISLHNIYIYITIKEVYVEPIKRTVIGNINLYNLEGPAEDVLKTLQQHISRVSEKYNNLCFEIESMPYGDQEELVLYGTKIKYIQKIDL